MALRALVFSDPHHHNWQQHSTVDDRGLNSRLLDSLNAVDQVRRHAVANSIPLVICLGDVFHSRGLVSVSVFNQVYQAYKSLSEVADLMILVGNHDYAALNGNVHSTQTFSSFATVIDEPGSHRVGGVDFCAVPYRENPHIVVKSIQQMAERSNPKVLLLHQGISGGMTSAYPVVLDRGIQRDDLRWWDFKFVFLGHYHVRQWLGRNSLYAGSLYPQSFGDVGLPKGFLDVDFGSDTVDFIETRGVPQFVRVEWEDVKAGVHEVWAAMSGNIVHVTVRDRTPVDEVKDTVRKSDPRSFIVEIQRQKEESKRRTDLDVSMSLNEMVDRYVQSGLADTEDYEIDRLVSVGKDIVGRSAQ